MKKIKVCFYPSIKKETNHFLANLAQVLTETGEFECSGFMDHVRAHDGEVYKQEIYHFNWFDQAFSLSSFLYRFFILLRLILTGKKLVWTVHNVTSHEKSPVYNTILRAILLRFSSRIHVMNEASLDFPFLKKYKDKVTLVPHGDYFGSYPESNLDLREKFGIAPDSPIILFVGAIRPYKNVEVLLSAFAEVQKETATNASLLICGKTNPPEYLQKLQGEMDKMNNVFFSPTFIPDEDMEAYLREAAFLVTPYSYRSALNSGTVLLACSYSRTVVCPDIAGIQDIQRQAQCLYMYHYDNESAHVGVLKETVKKALQEFTSGEIKSKEKAAFAYMKENSWCKNVSKWRSLYNG